jgi:hypothetical protein
LKNLQFERNIMNKKQSILLATILLANSIQLKTAEIEHNFWHNIKKAMPQKGTVLKALCITGTLATALGAYYYGYFSALADMVTKKKNQEVAPKFFSANVNKKPADANNKISRLEQFMIWLLGEEPKANEQRDPFIKADGNIWLPESGKVNIYTSAACENKYLQTFFLQETSKLATGDMIESYIGQAIKEEHWVSNMADNSFNYTVTSEQIPFMAILRDKTGNIKARFIMLVDTRYQFAKIILSTINFTAGYDHNRALFSFVRTRLKNNFHVHTLENDTLRVETESFWAYLGCSGAFNRL